MMMFYGFVIFFLVKSFEYRIGFSDEIRGFDNIILKVAVSLLGEE